MDKNEKLPLVIVVGDSSFRKDLDTLFESSCGFDACVEAQNAGEAIAKTKQLLPRLAIVDFSLPEMSGLQAARKLKRIAPKLLIFLLTPDDYLDIEKEALSCGITAVFSKHDMGTLVANARAVCGMGAP